MVLFTYIVRSSQATQSALQRAMNYGNKVKFTILPEAEMNTHGDYPHPKRWPGQLGPFMQRPRDPYRPWDLHTVGSSQDWGLIDLPKAELDE